jgi:hypothetical protein
LLKGKLIIDRAKRRIEIPAETKLVENKVGE